MQLGCCCSLKHGQAARAAGFDYLECPVVSLLPDEDDTVFASILEKYRASALPVRAFNVFLPGDLKIVGPEIDEERLQRYVTRALKRVQVVGAQVVGFGMGAARAIPEGFSQDEAVNQIVQFLHSLADAAEGIGVTVAIEPLNRKESNVINSVAEAVEFARQVNRTPIRVLADFYHMDEENEPLAHLAQYRDWIAHIHVADTGRRAPGTGKYPYEAFAEQLRQANYDGMVSVECFWDDPSALDDFSALGFLSATSIEEARRSVRFLRQVLG